MKFEWDDEKADANEAKHGVSFAEARTVFLDDFAIEFVDEAHSTVDETRYAIIGLGTPGLLFVVYTEPEPDTVRFITARHAETWMVEEYEQAREGH